MKLNKLEKSILLTVAALALATGIASADIEDTVASSEAKYGKPTYVEAPYLVYSHNGWWIRQTYNANEVCVMVEFARLDGKKITDTQAHSLDSHNLPAYTLSTTGMGNGWTTDKWTDNDRQRSTYSFVYSTSATHCQVIAGLSRYGNDKVWYWTRSYVTPAGLEIVKQENAKNDSNASASQSDTTTPDTNI